MSFSISALRRHGLLCVLPLLFSACGPVENSRQIRTLKAQIADLKQQTENLHAETEAMNQKMEITENAEPDDEKNVKNLQSREENLNAEGERLEKMTADLKFAITRLKQEHADFIQKYPIR